MQTRSDTIAATITLGMPGKDHTAFVETSGEELSYGNAADLISELAEKLLSFGIKAGDVVGLVSSRNPFGLISFLAISSVAICCPIGARQRTEEILSALNTMGVSTLIDGSGDQAAIDVATNMGLRVATCRMNDHSIELLPHQEGCSASIENIGVDNSIALIMRTSGTTSKPKLVGLSHDNVLAAASSIRDTYNLSEADFCFNLMPLYHVHGLISAGMSSLLSGSRQMCTGPMQPEKFADAYPKMRPTWFTGSPPVHLALRDYYERTGQTPSNDRLRFFRSSSAPFPAPAVDALEKLFGAPLLENYGMTETASTVCSNLLPPAKRKAGGVGSSISAKIKVVDDKGTSVPQGDEGEILLKGPSIITRYLGSDEINATNFDDGWLKTGDVGYFDKDDDLFVIGRTKELIKRGGESIYPSEVDNALAAYDDISEAITFAISHPTLGEELVAAVVLKSGSKTSEQMLRRYLATELSTFKVPSKIILVSSIPKNETGKVQRRTMARAFAEQFEPTGAAPETETEVALLSAWRGVLRRDDIGVTDNLFVLGADPLRSKAVSETIGAQLGKEITAKEIFQNPSVREQAAILVAS